MPTDSHVPVQWFFGNVTAVAADLYVRVHGKQLTGGIVSGPRSAYARTLEASVPLVPIDTSQGLWWAKLEEPCFWTPRQPYLYTARLESCDDRRQNETMTVTLGVPVLVPKQRSLESAGKNWVLRAMRGTVAAQELLPACHATGTSLFVDSPDNELCQSASVVGVQLVADLTAISPSEVECQLRHVARWPAVGIAVLPKAAELDPLTRRETAHVIRGQAWRGNSPETPRDWAQLLIVDRENLAAARVAVVAESPGIIVRQRLDDDRAATGAETQVARGRKACDSLQAELAGWLAGGRELVGYVVG